VGNFGGAGRSGEARQRAPQPAGHLQAAGRGGEVQHLLVVAELQPVQAGEREVLGEQVMPGKLRRELGMFTLKSRRTAAAVRQNCAPLSLPLDSIA
jgi:hypothetical protein